MSDGRRQGVLDSSPLLEVAATGAQMPQIQQQRFAAEGSSQPVNDTRVKDPDLKEQDNESSDDDDDPLLQELKEELEQSTFWDSNLTQRQQQQQQENSMEGTQKEIHQPPSQQSYDARIAALMERMDEEQMNRFEAFRRSTLSRANMKKFDKSNIE